MENYHNKIPGWGKDSISKFIENAIHNTYATFNNLKPQHTRLNEINCIFEKILQNLDNTSDWFISFFFFRSHSAFLAGVRLTMSGQIPEAYMVLRGCLENALYALYLKRHPEDQKTWIRRHNDEKSKKKVQREFAIRKILNYLQSEHNSLYLRTNELYEKTIDLGAHPNPKGLFSMLRKSGNGENVFFESIYLSEHSPPLQACLKSCSQIGVCSLMMFRRIYKERFDLLELSSLLDDLRHRIDS